MVYNEKWSDSGGRVMLVTNIIYDTDGYKMDLPTEMEWRIIYLIKQVFVLKVSV